MGPPSYMRSFVDRNVVMRRMISSASPLCFHGMLQGEFNLHLYLFLCTSFVTQTNVLPTIYQVKSFVSSKGKDSVQFSPCTPCAARIL